MIKKEKEVKKDSVELKEIKKNTGLKFTDKFKLKFKPTISFLISMHFSNGTCKSFVVASKTETFDYKKKTYYLRYENAWFDLTHNLYRLNYFDDFPLPIDRKVIKQGDSKFFAVTPENIKPLLKMEYVKALAQSHEISKYLKMCLLLSAVTLLGIIIVGFLVYNGGKVV